MTETPPRISEEIGAALDAYGLGPRRLFPISLFQGRKRGRYAFLAEAEDGGRVKVRYLPSAEDARLLCELQKGLEPAFAPVLERHGGVLIEEWVAGRALSESDAEVRAEEAGGLLGRLHAKPLGEGGGKEVSTGGYAEGAESDLAILGEAGKLSRAEANSLRATLKLLDPGSFRLALIHLDFCPENFVIDVAGRLVVIDNEWFRAGAPGFDLGRTYHRWPMSDAAWERFRTAHSSAGTDPGPLGFWMIASTLFGARVFLELMPPRLDHLLVLLREMADGKRLFHTPLR